ncbi:MAG: alpha-amylase family glycosyl hydrolase [Eubacteriales bacterium]|nr:alpha-amylase family glycosyl hydrolase [Eubacteriales bacterium]
MKKCLAFLLAIVMVLSFCACSADDTADVTKETTAVKTNEYVLSKDVKEGSVIDGVMTDIAGSDPILEKTTASWLDTCVLYEVNVRQYTEEGTFKAFEDHLQRLKDMGINTLWFMPIHPISETERKGTLGSYYAVDDYMEVNPEFGTKEDFQNLVYKAHDMGFKVIIDWVANHTGWDNAWVKEHDDWFMHGESGKITSPYDWTDTAELNFDNYEMRAEMIKCMQYWVEEVGIDGFRCDHAIGVPASFWNAAVYKLKSINSEIMMLAEVSAAQSLTQYAFDTCYNDALYGQAMMVKGGVATSTIQQGMIQNANYVDGSFPMNYLDNHDKNSYDGSIVDRFGDTYEPMLALTYLAPGFPLIYTSNEQGYDHEIAFFEKDAVVWEDDMKYAQLITELSKLKVENKALASTNTDLTINEVSNTHIFAFTRQSGDNKVVYVGNLFFEEIKDAGVTLDIENAKCVMHYDGETLSTEETDVTKADFENKSYKPYEFYILVVE